MDEIAADFTYDLLTDTVLFEDLARENRSVAGKLLDAIRDFISKVKAVFCGNRAAQDEAARSAYGVEMQELEEAARLWKQAYDVAGETAKAAVGNNKAAQTDGGTRFSIKRTGEMTLAQQLKEFYDGKLRSSDALYFGKTPDTLHVAGLDALPLAFTTTDFRKSAKGKHNVPRRVWKSLNDDLKDALFAFVGGDRVGIMTADIDGDGKPLLVGIERNAIMDREPVNAIRSVYGLDNPGYWLKNQVSSGKKFIPLDKKRADTFLQTYGAYSATVGDDVNSMADSVPQDGKEVKEKFSLKEPVEETKTLLALHNLTADKLWGDLRLGGFPMPSIAVTRTDIAHTNFGDITLVMDKGASPPWA